MIAGAALSGLLVLASVRAAAIAAEPPAAGSPSAASLQQSRRALQHQRAEVRRLQQALARQQRLNRQAGERLRQQDAAIAALQKLREVCHTDVQPGGH